MHTATPDSLPTKKLIQEMAKQPAPWLSVLFRLEDAPAARKLRLEALLHTAPAALAAPVRETIEQNLAHVGAIAVYAANSHVWAFDVASGTPDFAETADSFNISPLIAALSESCEFYLLALSHKHTRLIHCTLTDFTEVPLPAGFPTNLSDFTTHPDRSAAFVTNDSADKRDEYMRHFFKEIDKQVGLLLADKPLPLILAGVDYELALFHKLSEYPLLAAGGVSGSPDGIKGHELLSRALEVLKAYNHNRDERVLAIHHRAPAHRVSTDPAAIAAAAAAGRVLYLFADKDAKRLGCFNEATSGIEPSESVNLINWMAIETYKHGGDVFQLPHDSMPGGAELAAYMRY